ncbi:integrator complex subunit 1 [Teleopsis dalmanni]|uniref:integrator complex subunit 1 n=1 Tax=Teleopsis dalmanni TaxID=139649 RepID=UPI0018CD1920|nr:integrator complex subunit 1 [Teleopsis dalmanni]
MERNRHQKIKPAHLGSELFALGSKVNREDSKSKTSSKTAVPIDRKRDSGSISISNVTKKQKLSASVRTSTEQSKGFSELWEQMAVECETGDLIENIYTAIDQNDKETVIKYLCGCIKQLQQSTNSKIDVTTNLILFYIAKTKPRYFYNDVLTSALVCTIRRETNAKTRCNINNIILATNLLTKGFHEKTLWPEIFLRIYIEDAINERIWVDNPLCAFFTSNLCAAFNTIIPNQSLLQLESSTQQQRMISLSTEDDSGDNTSFGVDFNAQSLRLECEQKRNGQVCSRFDSSSETIEKEVIEAVKEQLNKRQQQECYTRNFLKFLCTTSGLVDVRFLTISRLELWIHNGKLTKLAQHLLAYICLNIKSKSSKDHEVLASLVKMRPKTKPLINFYMACLKEMIVLQPDILGIILKLVVQNELSNTRNPNNMGILATLFQTSPELSATHLAEIYKEFLLQRDDCLRTLRVFLRELVRMLRFDLNLVQFCKVFLNGRPDLTKQIEESDFKDRIFYNMVDIVCLCMILEVSPQVRETTLSLRSSRDFQVNSVLTKFYNHMGQIQLNILSWMYEAVPSVFKIQNAEYSQALHKILLLENVEHYSRSDQWPSEPERATLLRIVAETPIHEEELLRIILIGITKDIPFSVPETIEIIMLVIKRASAMKATNYPAVEANKYEIIDFLFNMAEYHYPENIKLPEDYEPPKLAISILYWKAWMIMLMISAHNPSSFGSFCWNQYPTMKTLIEMCITNQFNENNGSKEEPQIQAIERNHILEFETHLAAQTSQTVITEENAILLTQLTLMNPMGQARKVPVFVLEQLKQLNKSLKLGHLLCRSRKPDLLLDIIQRQGTTQSMPWLSDLVQNSDGDFNHLPVQCLCEFLLFSTNALNEENKRDTDLVNYLRGIIMDPYAAKQTVCEVLDYIFRRLSSTVKQSRVAALKGLQIIFKTEDADENDWLLLAIPQLQYFTEIRSYIVPQLRSACQVENSPQLVMLYIQFIAAHTLNDSVTETLDHVMDMAQLIVERSTMFQHIIPTADTNDPLHECRSQTLKCLLVMFNNYIIKLREHHEPYEWAEYPDLLMVQFHDGVELPLHLHIIHAFIILLTHSTSTMSESFPILDYWFPPNQKAPTAYLPNLPHEPVQLLPDWLKLRMIRSSVDRLVTAAIQDLTPDQIILFIQNFGTPVNSMSRLLALLDIAVEEQEEVVKATILNKAYLSQLIEIQRARGAKNGHVTVKKLGLNSHSQTVPDLPKIQIDDLETITLNNFSLIETTESKTDKIKVVLNHTKNYTFRKLMYQIRNPCDFSSSNEKEIEFIITNILNNVQQQFSSIGNDEAKFRICTVVRGLVDLKEKLILVDKIKHSVNLINETINNLLVYSKKLPNDDHFLLALQSVARTNETSKTTNKRMFNKITDADIAELSNISKLGVWNIDLDPEVFIVEKKVKIDFLFSKDSPPIRYYFLSVMCHQSHWSTLITMLDHVLQERTTNYDCSTVLSFIESIIYNPKLWQGRDKRITNADVADDIIHLEGSKLNAFTNLILKEAESDDNYKSEKYDQKLCSRINLLFIVTKKKDKLLAQFIEYIDRSDCPEELKYKVLQQMYLMYPKIKFIKKDTFGKNPSKLLTLKGCQADKISNNLITCFGNLNTKKDFELLSPDTDLLIRKLAASHPALFVRQLGVLMSLLEGKAELNIQVIREDHHINRFVQILRTLELIKPILFDDAYKTDFHAGIVCYFKFLKNHIGSKETFNIVYKFADLLLAYINANPNSAFPIIEQYFDVLMNLVIKFNSLTVLHQLIQSVNTLRLNSWTAKQICSNVIIIEDQSESNSRKTSETDISDSSANTTVKIVDKFSVYGTTGFTFNKRPELSEHFLHLIKLVKTSNEEEILIGPLLEIENLTSKRFTVLSEIFERLLELIFSSSAHIRSNAFILLIRHLTHNPGNADINKSTFNAYIQCLRDDNSSVASTAVDNLPEMTILLQEYAVPILCTAFYLGTRSRMNTSNQIKRVLHTLLLQHGY